MKLRKTAGVICACALLGLLVFAGCDNFFSSSWGNGRSYDSSKITVNAKNVDSWILEAKGNPALAAAVTDKIIQVLETGGLSAAEKGKLQEAGVGLAIDSSGIGGSIIKNADGVIDKLNGDDAAEAVKDILVNIYTDFSNGSGPKAADDLAKVLGITNPGNNGTPQFPANDPYVKDGLADTDVMQAVTVLMLGACSKKNINAQVLENEITKDDFDFNDFVNTYGLGLKVEGRDVKIDTNAGGEPSNEAIALAAYLNLIGDGKVKGSLADSIKMGLGL